MSLKRNWAYALTASMMVAGSLSANAAEPSAASQMTKEKLGFWDTLGGAAKDFSLSYAAIIDGPGLADPLSGNQAAQADSRLDLFNRFSLGYNISKDVTVSAQLRYVFYLNEQNVFDLEDTRFFLTKSGVIKTPGFSLDTFLVFDVATSKIMIDRDMTLVPGAGVFFSGDLPNSRWSYWGIAQLRGGLFHGDGNVDSTQYRLGWDLEFLMNPFVYYRLSNTVQAALGQVMRVRKDRFMTNGSHQTGELWETDVGLVWEFTKNWSVNPYLLVDTTDIKWKNTGLSVFLSGRIF